MWAKACKEVKVAGKTEFSLTDILKSGMMGNALKRSPDTTLEAKECNILR